MQKRKNRWYIAVAAVVILAVVLVLAVVLGKKGKNKKDPKMIEPTQQEQASEIPTETEEVFDYSATETAETKSLPKSVVSKQGILIDVDAGTILAGKDALKRMVPASMTKIFTVLVAAILSRSSWTSWLPSVLMPQISVIVMTAAIPDTKWMSR